MKMYQDQKERGNVSIQFYIDEDVKKSWDSYKDEHHLSMKGFIMASVEFFMANRDKPQIPASSESIAQEKLTKVMAALELTNKRLDNVPGIVAQIMTTNQRIPEGGAALQVLSDPKALIKDIVSSSPRVVLFNTIKAAMPGTQENEIYRALIELTAENKIIKTYKGYKVNKP